MSIDRAERTHVDKPQPLSLYHAAMGSGGDSHIHLIKPTEHSGAHPHQAKSAEHAGAHPHHSKSADISGTPKPGQEKAADHSGTTPRAKAVDHSGTTTPTRAADHSGTTPPAKPGTTTGDITQPDKRREHDSSVQSSEDKIEAYLKKNPHDFRNVFQELGKLRKSDHNDKLFHQDLKKIDEDLQKKGLLPKLHLIEDDRYGATGKWEKGFAAVSEGKDLPGGRRAEVSTSHHAPHESHRLRNIYHHMHYKHGHWNGWNHSTEGHHGAHGGYNEQGPVGKVPTGARKELIDKALELAGLPATASNEAAVNKIVTRESGWNPNAVNNWDSNARAGHPSRGLMQAIPSTFHKFALPGLNNNINDPLSNMVACIRYAQSRYARGGRSGVEVVASRPGGY